MIIEEVRTANVRLLVEKYGYSCLEKKTGRSRSQLSQWANTTKDSKSGKILHISSKSCRMIEEALSLNVGWMDTDHRKEKLAEQRPVGESPYLGENSVPWYPRPDWKDVGNWEKPEKWFCCNTDHSDETFCITIRDMSLYKPNDTTATIIKGDIAFVDPNAKYDDGDFVFATSSHYKLASVKQYIIQGPNNYLFTPNPSWQEQWVPVDDTIKIHGKVISISRKLD